MGGSFGSGFHRESESQMPFWAKEGTGREIPAKKGYIKQLGSEWALSCQLKIPQQMPANKDALAVLMHACSGQR